MNDPLSRQKPSIFKIFEKSPSFDGFQTKQFFYYHPVIKHVHKIVCLVCPCVNGQAALCFFSETVVVSTKPNVKV